MKWSEKDLQQLENHQVAVQEAERQLAMFKNPPPPLQIDRPCTPGDGILHFSVAEKVGLAKRFDAAATEGRFSRFIPASGAASRMFKELFDSCDPLLSWYRDGHCPQSSFHQNFFSGLNSFAFYQDLEKALEDKDLHLEKLIAERDLSAAVKGLLEPWGLDYARRPKGLLAFHQYAEGARTPLEEHLVEAATLHGDSVQPCRLHFTVSPEFMADFSVAASQACTKFERRFGIRFDISFSCQEGSTDTLAVTDDNQPFRIDDGDLLFRPSGHGALLNNLNAIGGDLVLIKNIDNVVPEHLQPAVVEWWKLLGGKLLEIDDQIKELQQALNDEPGEDTLNTALKFLHSTFLLEPPETDRLEWLLTHLSRPLRICGMVRNLGEPGGGPYWVRNPQGCTAQIVEMAQIPDNDPVARKAVSEATHFNPVLMACSLRDANGEPYPLERFVDEQAIIITEKSQGGRGLKALERPGLWNGAMAGWNTLFVEVPVEIFQPVKTVNDLLRPGHQPPGH